MAGRRSTPKTTRTKTVKTPRLVKALELQAGQTIKLTTRDRERVLTAVLSIPDRPDRLALKFETGAERIVATGDDVIVVDIAKIEVPV